MKRTATPVVFAALTGLATANARVVAGIPTAYLIKAGATVQDQTTAILTGVFAKGTLTSTTNGNMTNRFLGANAVNYYYHPNG
jgi:hypothetical protein